mmetsp:Transcript_26636/g.79824  ORF Transcript_26636/g.79824 Transcript_26636/m.79824 type:complete len:222 (-) Transcript_26636:334-999(-)
MATSRRWKSRLCKDATTPSAAAASSTGRCRSQSARSARSASHTCGCTSSWTGRTTTICARSPSPCCTAPSGSARPCRASTPPSRWTTRTSTTSFCSTSLAAGATRRRSRCTTSRCKSGPRSAGRAGAPSATECLARAGWCKGGGSRRDRCPSPLSLPPRKASASRAAAERAAAGAVAAGAAAAVAEAAAGSAGAAAAVSQPHRGFRARRRQRRPRLHSARR